MSRCPTIDFTEVKDGRGHDLGEIEARFAPDWVLIGEPQTDENQRLLAGRVLFHSRDREEVYRKAIELRPGQFAFRYLGEMPEDMAFVL